MAIVSSHILDSVSGGPAVGIRCQLFVISDASAKRLLFDVKADTDGRVAEVVDLDDADCGCEFELIFHSADYFSAPAASPAAMVDVLVMRLRFADSQRRYHLPVMLAPHSYSTWWSSLPA